jgi:hypothetical protein
MADEVVKSTFAQLQSDLMKRSELVSQIGERSGFANHKSERSRFAQVHVKALESRVALLARKQISFFCGHIMKKLFSSGCSKCRFMISRHSKIVLEKFFSRPRFGC